MLSFEKAGTINAAIATQSYPLFSIIIESPSLNKRKNKKKLIFTIILVNSLVFLGTNGTWEIEEITDWFILALMVPILWPITHVTIKNSLDHSPITPGQATFIRVLVGIFFLFIIASLVNGVDSLFQGFLRLEFQFYAIKMGFVFYLELLNWFYAVKHIDVSVASSITTPTPIVTMILPIIFLGETVVGYQLLTMLVAIISLYGLLYFGKKKEEIQVA